MSSSKFKNCIFGSLCCAQFFSVGGASNRNNTSFVHAELQENEKIRYCLRGFVDRTTPQYYECVYELLNARQTDDFSPEKDACALKRFVESYNGTWSYQVCESILEYALLSLGPKYKPGSAAVYIETLSPFIDYLAYRQRNIGIEYKQCVGILISKHIVQILDSCEYLPPKEKLRLLYWFISYPGNLALSLCARPHGTFEHVMTNDCHPRTCRSLPLIINKEGDKLFSELTKNKNIERFYNYLKDELHRVDYCEELRALEKIEALNKRSNRHSDD
ncbi:MAG: hypothetical protein LBQ43_00955 [Holosporales bacterium]|jgi:hypothetical protein|nr:hypothetical protein [Holosporales bacterium]